MTETPALRASDADRERAVVLLREHMVEGRLTLEEFADRMSTAYLARTTEELEHLSRDLPPVPTRSRRSPTRVVLAVFGSTGRTGRIRVHRNRHGRLVQPGGRKAANQRVPTWIERKRKRPSRR